MGVCTSKVRDVRNSPLKNTVSPSSFAYTTDSARTEESEPTQKYTSRGCLYQHDGERTKFLLPNRFSPLKEVRTKATHTSTNTSKECTTPRKIAVDLTTPPPTVYLDLRSHMELDVLPYLEDMMNHSLTLQHQLRPYDHLHDFSVAKRRGQMVSWLFAVTTKLSLTMESLSIAISILDRVLEYRTVCMDAEIQLLTCSALFVACKMEEVSPLPLSDLVYICNHKYTSNEIVSMETLILSTLQFRLSLPTLWVFCTLYMRALTNDREELVSPLHRSLLEFLCCIVQYDYALMTRYKLSDLAVGICHVCAMLLLDETPKPKDHWYNYNYLASQLSSPLTHISGQVWSSVCVAYEANSSDFQRVRTTCESPQWNGVDRWVVAALERYQKDPLALLK